MSDERIDPQMQSAKWRVDAVSILMKQDTEKYSRERRIVRQIEDTINIALQCLFGDKFRLDREPRLEEIVAQALNLNFKLKTQVIYLGDFRTSFSTLTTHTTIHECRSWMSKKVILPQFGSFRRARSGFGLQKR